MATRREIESKARKEAKDVRHLGIVLTIPFALSFLASTVSMLFFDGSTNPLFPLVLGLMVFLIFRAVSRLYSLVADLASPEATQPQD